MNFTPTSQLSIFLFLIFILNTVSSIPILNSKGKNPSLCSTSTKIINNQAQENFTLLSDVNSQFDLSECEMITDGPVCLFNTDRIILPYAKLPDLNGYWDFENSRPIDNSGNQNHGFGKYLSGPAFGGYGSSALFKEGNYITIPHKPMFTSNEFSITFFAYFNNDPSSITQGVRYCPLIQKGDDDLFAKTYQRGPAIYFDRQSKNLKVIVKTGNEENPEGEALISKSRLLPQKWFHIGLVKNATSLILYVNGIKDSELLLKGSYEDNTSPLYIGNVPWLKGDCVYPFLMDEVRYYKKAISKDHIQGEASPILGGVEPAFIKLGCFNCDVTQAAASCNEDEGYRLCTSIELHTGGYQIARGLGLLESDTHIWTHNAFEKSSDYKGLLGLGLCCSILK